MSTVERRGEGRAVYDGGEMKKTTDAFDVASDYGFTVVETLHFLKGREYGVIEANYVSTLRPSHIEVVKHGSSITTDAQAWRVRIFLSREDKIERIEQEAYISLDGGYRDGHELKNAMLATHRSDT